MRKKYYYNDYELLYLLEWHSEEAMNILVMKYTNFIHMKLHKFHIKEYHYEDFFQECLMTLLIAIRKYDETSNKTFCRFFELLLDRRIMRLLENDCKYQEHFSTIECDDFPNHEEQLLTAVSYEKKVEDLIRETKNTLKGDILQEIFFEGSSIEEFAKDHQMNKKDVYNHIYLLRSIAKQKLKD